VEKIQIKNKKLSKLADTFIVFAMVFGVAMLLICLYFSLVTWLQMFKPLTELGPKMFWISLLFAIVSGMSSMFERFIKQFAVSYNNLANK
jgi:hypothetical protein